jgi:hypothetical protein
LIPLLDRLGAVKHRGRGRCRRRACRAGLRARGPSPARESGIAYAGPGAARRRAAQLAVNLRRAVVLDVRQAKGLPESATSSSRSGNSFSRTRSRWWGRPRKRTAPAGS